MRFSYAAVYQVEAACATPLRTGGADGDMEMVLRRMDGRAFVQGASLAGALRGYLVQGADAPLTGALFGTQDQAGHLTVSDALFDTEAARAVRPRLRIDGATGTAARDGQGRGGKFDAAHMEAGSRLSFSLVWQGLPEQKGELDALERLLGAMDAGLIQLGAQKSNGFGRLALSVRRRLFDLTVPAQRRAWLADDWAGEPLDLPAAEDVRRVRFTVKGAVGGILVKGAPKVDREGGRTKTYVSNLEEGGRALVPGSSVKGAVRARTAYIAKILGLAEDTVDRYFGRVAAREDQSLPGQVFFEDGILSGHRQRICRIRIDRFTGGVQRQGLFTEEPVSSALEFHITAPEEPVLCALLVYALRDLGLGLYTLGSGWAIGRGRVAVERIEISAPGGRRADLRFDGRGGLSREDPEDLLGTWLRTLEEVRHES